MNLDFSTGPAKGRTVNRNPRGESISLRRKENFINLHNCFRHLVPRKFLFFLLHPFCKLIFPVVIKEIDYCL